MFQIKFGVFCFVVGIAVGYSSSTSATTRVVLTRKMLGGYFPKTSQLQTTNTINEEGEFNN